MDGLMQAISLKTLLEGVMVASIVYSFWALAVRWGRVCELWENLPDEIDGKCDDKLGCIKQLEWVEKLNKIDNRLKQCMVFAMLTMILLLLPLLMECIDLW